MFFHDMKMLERVLWLKRIKGSGNPMHEATSTSGSFVTDVVAPLKSLKVTLEPIQSGSGTPSPDNVRPISGHTEVVTEEVGKNLLPTLSVSDFDNGRQYGLSTYIEIPFKKGTYTISTSAPTGYIWAGKELENSGYTRVFSGNPKTVTLDTDGVILFGILTTDKATALSYNSQVEYGTTATSYEPYQGSSYTTALGRTVYGGTLDVVSGELVVDRAMFTFDGDTSKWAMPANWYNVDVEDSNPTFGVYWYFNWALGWDSLPKPKLYVNSTDNAMVVSDKLTQNNYGTYKQSEPYKACISGRSTNSVYLGVRLPASVLSDTSSSAALNASVMEWFQNNPTEFCYLLAEPITIQLSPQEIETLKGQNNIITEDGVEVDEIVYMTRFVGSPLLGGSVPTPDSGDESEESNEESQEVGEDG